MSLRSSRCCCQWGEGEQDSSPLGLEFLDGGYGRNMLINSNTQYVNEWEFVFVVVS